VCLAVIEGGKSGSGKLLLGHSVSGAPSVEAKCDQPEAENFLLRLSVSDGRVTAAVGTVDAHQLTSVAVECAEGAAIEGTWVTADPAATCAGASGHLHTLGVCDMVAGSVSFGLMAHGGPAGCQDTATFHAYRIQQ